MLAALAAMPREVDRWAYEVKWDGLRSCVVIDDEQLRLFSRNGNDVTAAYPELQLLAAELAPRRAILDGEIVTLDELGAPSFSRRQRRDAVEGSRVRDLRDCGNIAAS
jgi:bifunctional non-homologous end joining protein LigD